jgi:hypothetical protein
VFSKDIKENIVKVGDRWWDGVDHYCYMTEVVSPTEVKCRLPLDLNREANFGYDVIYFASTYEEGNMNCNGDVCQHTFIDESLMPNISGVEAIFNQNTEKYELVFTGEEIDGHFTPGNPEDVDVFVGGEEQTILSANDNEVRVQIDSLKGGEGREAIDLFFPKGIPRGYEEYMDGVEFAPALVGLSAAEGSIAGSEIEASIPGIGINDKLEDGTEKFMLVNALTGDHMCTSVKVEEYGKLKCNTTAGDLGSGIELAVMNMETG